MNQAAVNSLEDRECHFTRRY